MTLSLPQLDALRYASKRQLSATDVDGGDGNRRRTFRSLFKLGMIAWDPICRGRVVLTTTGRSQLRRAHERKLARARGAIGATRRDPPGTLRIEDVGDQRMITLTGAHEEETR